MTALFGGKLGNRGKGRPRGSRNRLTPLQKLELEERREELERKRRLRELETLVQEERLRRDLEDLRRPRRERDTRTRPPKDSQELVLRLAEGLVAAFGPALGRVLAVQQAGPAPTPGPALPPTPSTAAPPAEQAPAGASPDPAADAPALDFTSKVIVGQIDGKAPQQVAMLLANHRLEQVRAIAEGLRQCPDEATLAGYLEHIGPAAPYAAWWLRRPERWAWTVQTVAALRGLPAAS